MDTKNPASVDQRKAWIEPQVTSLAVSETAQRPNRGADGETIWIDCTS